MALFEKRVIPSTLCPRCRSKRETVYHALWSCLIMQEIWNVSCFANLAKNLDSWGDFGSLCASLVHSDGNWNATLFALLAWVIWFDKNERVQGKEGRSGTSLVAAAEAYVVASWCKPKEGEVKINVDAAVNPVSGRSGLGIICRNYAGVVIGSRAIPFRSVMDVELAEALAVLEGLRFVSSLGLKVIEVNSDAFRAVKMLLDNSPPMADAGVFILDALDLEKSFTKVSFFHVLQSANKEANSLVAFAIQVDSLCSWGISSEFIRNDPYTPSYNSYYLRSSKTSYGRLEGVGKSLVPKMVKSQNSNSYNMGHQSTEQGSLVD
ncbi:hypothetical protein LguiA_029694 [Lonicera macranthoides]